MEKLGVTIFGIPARSPDLNPIENLFNQLRRRIKQESLVKNIVQESKEEFTHRVKGYLESYDIGRIDRLIESMPNRVRLVLKAKGQRIRY